MINYICKFCNNSFEFAKSSQCGGHTRNCNSNPAKIESNIKASETNKFRSRQNKNKRIEDYDKNPVKCAICSNKIDYKRKKQKYCGHSCAAKATNKLKKGIKKNFSENGLANIRIARKRKSEKFNISEFEKYNTEQNKCLICKNLLPFKKRKNKTCSNKCKNELGSINRSKKILERGTDNFKTKTEIFSYKFVKDFRCDSKLEIAALVYLIDYFKAEKIERFKSILSFEDNYIKRRFNPDFYVEKNNKIYIVEVKMKWIKNSKHIYNRTIPLKKEALKTFCEKKNYEMIWLDCDYDIEFKKVYKEISRKGNSEAE